MQEPEKLKILLIKTKEILDLLKKIDTNDPLLLDTYLIIEYLQLQLLELMSDYKQFLNEKIENELKIKITESLEITKNTYENIQKILSKVYIYRQAQTEIYLINLINSKENEKTSSKKISRS